MIKRNTWILLGVFALLLGVVWYTQRNPADIDEPVIPSVQDLDTLLKDFFPAEVVSIRFESETGEAASFALGDEGIWAFAEAETTAEFTDSARIQAAVTQLANLQIISALESNPKLPVLGLFAPDYTITLELLNGEQIKIFIGSKTPIGNGYYARLQGDRPRAIAIFAVDTLIDLLNTPPVFPTPTPEITETLETVPEVSTPTETPTPEDTSVPEASPTP